MYCAFEQALNMKIALYKFGIIIIMSVFSKIWNIMAKPNKGFKWILIHNPDQAVSISLISQFQSI